MSAASEKHRHNKITKQEGVNHGLEAQAGQRSNVKKIVEERSKTLSFDFIPRQRKLDLPNREKFRRNPQDPHRASQSHGRCQRREAYCLLFQSLLKYSHSNIR
jgi:hypothetical protein